MVDYNELERRVFEKLQINPNNKPDDFAKMISQTIDMASIRNAIHVLAEYEKMKNENQ